MKKQILNIGKALNRAEQKQINGGEHRELSSTCPSGCSGLKAGDWCQTSNCDLGVCSSGLLCGPG